ncbi:transposase InsO family protein [Lewinella aquimaris]|uniref:Transposase InsO family protein n=1 Tax=Neolewinella aquimaris TaxID=1835722 RepID=A0A840EA32_9BACT|nr:helix-turn-helix domain-containing protein [Neolewinella aquimaris]MBB4080803.1 transposase InsO family protein [Neolewinella aquimaris]
MKQRIQFIHEVLQDKYTFSSLCQFYNISRQTGYAIMRRYRQEGIESLAPRSSRPLHSPGRVGEEIEELILSWRDRYPKNPWGAKKIRPKLVEEYGESGSPSVTTIQNVLKRRGRIKPAKARRRKPDNVYPKYAAEACNDIWTIDYKGHFRLGNGKRCHPLTVCDAKSHFILRIKGHYHERWKVVRGELRALFRQYGQPQYLHSDNGSCFASIQSPRGFGRLSFWLIDHGIHPLFSDPGHPGQNGSHERMHRDLKAACCGPSCWDLRTQNRLMNTFARDYNEVRPHEELGQVVPASIYLPSQRVYQERVAAAEYDQSQLRVLKVSANGAIRWGNKEWVSVNRALAGRYVGVKQVGERLREVYYRNFCLGSFELADRIEPGRYYRLISSADLPQRFRDRHRRNRKGK